MKQPDSDPTRKGDLARIHMAKAALGQKDACKAYEKAAMDFCMTISPEPAAATPVSGTPIPATPAP